MVTNISKRIDLHSMEILVRIADHGSFSKAADAVGLVPSAVSRRVTELESTLGVVLLHRSPRAVRFTTAGEEVLARARVLVAEAEEIWRRAAWHAEEGSMTLRVEASVTALVKGLPQSIDRFLKTWPRVRIDLHKTPSTEVIHDLKTDGCDIGIFVSDRPVNGVVAQPYQHDRLCVLMPAGHALTRRRSLTFADLAAHDIVGPPPGTAVRLRLESEAALQRIPLRERVQGTSLDTIVLMVRAGMGVALVPAGARDAFVMGSDLVEVELKEGWAERQLYIGSGTQGERYPAARLLIEQICTEGTQAAGV